MSTSTKSHSDSTVPNTYEGMVELLIYDLKKKMRAAKLEAEAKAEAKAEAIRIRNMPRDPRDYLDTGSRVLVTISNGTKKPGMIMSFCGDDIGIKFDDGIESMCTFDDLA